MSFVKKIKGQAWTELTDEKEIEVGVGVGGLIDLIVLSTRHDPSTHPIIYKSYKSSFQSFVVILLLSFPLLSTHTIGFVSFGYWRINDSLLLLRILLFPFLFHGQWSGVSPHITCTLSIPGIRGNRDNHRQHRSQGTRSDRDEWISTGDERIECSGNSF